MKAIQETDPNLFEELGGVKTVNDDKKVYKLSSDEKESKLVELVIIAREINQKSGQCAKCSVITNCLKYAKST
jgi:IS5 family transposase